MTTQYRFGYVDPKNQENLSAYGFKILAEGYDDKTIRNIYDSYAGGAVNIPVAVPSPYAVLNLVKVAFDNACQLIINKADTIKITEENGREKLEPMKNEGNNVLICREDVLNVFNTLDLAELVFNGIIDCIELKQTDIDDLKKSKDERHSNLGTVLDEYKELENDDFGLKDSSNNFKFCLLKYKSDVIGGSSNATLFFPTRNNRLLKNASESLNTEFSKRNWFDHNDKIKDKISGTYESIAEILTKDFTGRGVDFKKWIIQLLDGNNIPIGKYINSVRGDDINGESIKENIDAWKNKYNPNKHVVEDISTIVQERNDITEKCFIIDNADISKSERDKFLNELYTTSIGALKEAIKILNNQGMKDNGIFADYLVRIPHIVSDKFNVIEVNGAYYLPPINKNTEYSFKDIECREAAGGQGVEISLKSDKNVYKVYNDSAAIDRRRKIGRIVTGDFNVALFPFIKGAKEYKIQLVERIRKENLVQSNKVWVESAIKSNLAAIDDEPYFVRRQDMDVKTTYINLLHPNHGNLSINLQMKCEGDDFNVRLEPNFKDNTPTRSNETFVFAVDFGTTNTHIACKINGRSETFSLDNYVATLIDFNNPSADWHHGYLVHEFLPLNIGKPTFRTVLFSNKNADDEGRNTDQLREKFKDIGVYNIPFGYGSLSIDGDKLHSNIKWQREHGEHIHFLREMGLLLYTKVLKDGGKSSLNKTEIYFTWPHSMPEKVFNGLKKFWMDFYKEFFLDNMGASDDQVKEKIKEVSESFAPVLYYMDHQETPVDCRDKLVLCVDIGGGTTDCGAIIKHTSSQATTCEMPLESSFRFASNSIFGGTVDPIAKTEPMGDMFFNSMTEKYKKLYEDILQEKKLNHTDFLYGMGESNFYKIVKSKESGEINNWLFTFDSEFEDRHKYVKKLKNDERFKIVFLYYFFVIIYHVAKSLKERYGETKLPSVSEIVFSGYGSKVLNILDFKENKNVLEEMVLEVFSKVLGEKWIKECSRENNFKIKMRFDDDNAKELTAKGSLEFATIGQNIKITSGESKEFYGGFISNENLCVIRNNFESFRDIFLEIVKKNDRWKDTFDISKRNYLLTFESTLKEKLEEIFIRTDNRITIEDRYKEGNYVSSPLFPFEMMIFKAFSALSTLD